MAKLFAPDGTPIVSTLERVPGSCDIINENVTRNEDGTFDFEWCGETELHWDGQETVERDITLGGSVMQRVFIDADGDEWLESQLVLRDEDDV